MRLPSHAPFRATWHLARRLLASQPPARSMSNLALPQALVGCGHRCIPTYRRAHCGCFRWGKPRTAPPHSGHSCLWHWFDRRGSSHARRAAHASLTRLAALPARLSASHLPPSIPQKRESTSSKPAPLAASFCPPPPYHAKSIGQNPRRATLFAIRLLRIRPCAQTSKPYLPTYLGVPDNRLRCASGPVEPDPDHTGGGKVLVKSTPFPPVAKWREL